jgi:riboflavin transporter FmnP
MTELRRGAIAGVGSGVIYGPINWLFINLGLNIGHLEYWGSGLVTDGMWVLSCITKNLISGLIFGLVFGLMYVALYDKLPSTTSTAKGVMMSIIYWIAVPLSLSMLSRLHRDGIEGLYWSLSSLPFVLPIAIGLGTCVLWGWLLGRFWASEQLGKL